MKKISSYLLSVLLLLAVKSVFAQDGGMDYYTTAKGEVFKQSSAMSEVEGSPYMMQKWLPGMAKSTNGKTFDKLNIKYDAYNDMPIFVYDTNDQPQKFSDDISSFTLMAPLPMTFVKGFPDIDKQTSASYYQVIYKGKLSLIKHYSKSVINRKNYDSSVTQLFQDLNNYYIVTDASITGFDKSKKAVLLAMADKKEEINKYLENNPVKSDTDLAKLFDYYNSLK